MRIIDWSSDVCSSDLHGQAHLRRGRDQRLHVHHGTARDRKDQYQVRSQVLRQDERAVCPRQCQIQRRGQLWKTHGNGQVMATRPKGAGYKSRFDFRPHTDSDEPTTGTLKELLAEINYEYRPATGTEIKLDGLGGKLKFISRFTPYARSEE